MKQSVRNNAIANYLGTFYALVVGIICLPLYLRYLGAEAYGLVGFFAVLQAWLGILDLGFSPTLSRQAAYARSKPEGFDTFADILKSFELLFALLSVTIFVVMYSLSDIMAANWFIVNELAEEKIAFAVILMGLIVATRFQSTLHRSGIMGLEQQVWLNKANVIFATLKFVVALLFMAFVSADITHYFIYQALIAVIEYVVIRLKLYSLLPKGLNLAPRFVWLQVKKIMPFSLGIAYTALLWVLVTQLDKLILSKVLPLAEFGYFSLVAIIAGGLLQLTSPISQAIQPRLTFLFATGETDKALKLYRNSSQVVATIVFTVAVMLTVYAGPLLYAWSGDLNAAKWGEQVLPWFALGNAVLAMGAFQYYLQFALGKLKLHVIGSTVSAACQIPIITYAAIQYGAIGAGVAWFSFRCLFFLLWTPIVHTSLFPGLHSKWILKDLLPITIASLLSIILLHEVFLFDISLISRVLTLLYLSVVGLFLLALLVISSSFLRMNIKSKVIASLNKLK